MIWGAMSSAGVGPLCFFKTNVTAPFNQEMLEHCILPSAYQLFKDADFIFQQDLAPAHTAKGTKVKWPWCWCAWLASKLTRPEPHRESMGYCQEGNYKQETKKCNELKATIKETGLPYHLSSATKWSPPWPRQLRQ